MSTTHMSAGAPQCAARRLSLRMSVAATILALLLGCAALVSAPVAGAAAKHPAAHKKTTKNGKGKSKGKKPKGHTIKVKSGSVTLTFSSSAWSRINTSTGSAVGKSTTPVSPATATSTGAFTFPVGGGSINSSTGHGTVDATGGITIESRLSVSGLFSSSSSATATSPTAMLGKSANLTFTSSSFTPPTVALLELVTRGVKVASTSRSVTLSNVKATLTAAGAQFFGSSFKTGEQIGTVTIQAHS
jgi:Htaa protein